MSSAPQNTYCLCPTERSSTFRDVFPFAGNITTPYSSKTPLTAFTLLKKKEKAKGGES